MKKRRSPVGFLTVNALQGLLSKLMHLQSLKIFELASLKISVSRPISELQPCITTLIKYEVFFIQISSALVRFQLNYFHAITELVAAYEICFTAHSSLIYYN